MNNGKNTLITYNIELYNLVSSIGHVTRALITEIFPATQKMERKEKL